MDVVFEFLWEVMWKLNPLPVGLPFSNIEDIAKSYIPN